MGKSFSSVVYELKCPNPNQIANFSEAKVMTAVGGDMNKFVGKVVPGLVIKMSGATALVKTIKDDMVKKKVAEPWLRAGISGSDMIFVCTDLKGGSYEKSCVLVEKYVQLRETQKNQKGMVVNLDKGDDVIDEAAEDMGKAMGVKAVTGDKAKFAGVAGTAPIVLLAHGDEDKTSSGQIYGKDFAGKSPDAIVKFLLDNSDPKKRLSPEYAGTIYLDGCFTAQGGAMANYCQQVWGLLKSRGLKKVSVKGNLGAAATQESGDEIVTTTEAEEEVEKLNKAANLEYAKQVKPWQDKKKVVWAKYSKKKDEAGYKKDPEYLTAKAEMEKIRKTLSDKLTKDVEKVPGYEVKNFVGTFGLATIN